MDVLIRSRSFILYLLLLIGLIFPDSALSWSAPVHTFVAQKAGVPNPESANFPDFFKKDNMSLMDTFHWHNASPISVITPDYIERFQIIEGNYIKLGTFKSKPVKIRMPDSSGVLYWKILELYQEMIGKVGWEYEFYLINIAHYVADLSQPLHNFPYENKIASNGKIYREIGSWAKENHEEFDTNLDFYFPLDQETGKIFDSYVNVLSITSIDDLKREISNVANTSIALANRCYSEKRIMTKGEALRQVSMSVSLLKAIIASTKGKTALQAIEIKK